MGASVVCKSAGFRRAVETAARAVSPRTALPVLGAILVEAEPGRLRFRATDLEIAIRQEIEAEVHNEAAVGAPARLLVDLASHFEAEHLQIDLDPAAASLALKCGDLASQLRCLDADDFPPAPLPDAEQHLEVAAAALAAAIGDVIMAVSGDEARPIMTGVLIRAEPGRLSLTASDGYRLAERRLGLEGSGPEFSLVVPARALAEVSRGLRDGQREGGRVRLSRARAGNQAFVACGSFHLGSALIEGAYPNYAQVIPSSASTVAIASAPELGRALRAVSVLARDGGNAVRLDVGPAGIRAEASATEVGEASAQVRARVQGPPLRVAFNVRYLLDALAVLDDDVELSLDGPLRPAVLRRAGQDDYLHLIMPVRRAA